MNRSSSRSVAAKVVIRPATPSDAALIGEFGEFLIEFHHDIDSKRFLAATKATSPAYADFLRGKLADPQSIVLVAEDGGHILGYAYAAIEGYDYMSLRGPAGVVHDLFVEPGHRREGIGRQLLEAVLQAMKDRGTERTVLSTAYRNLEAQQLFSSLGFRPTMLEMTCELAK